MRIENDHGTARRVRKLAGALCAGVLACVLLACGGDADAGNNAAERTGTEMPNDTPPEPRDTEPWVLPADSTRDLRPGTEDGRTQAPNGRDGGQTAAPGEWTAGIVSGGAGASGSATLTEVRSARHEAYERVVFEFQGGSLPGYHVEYVDTPQHECGSGREVRLAGDAWLEVRFQPARAHDDEGNPTIGERQRTIGFPLLEEMRSTCDFEGHVTWVLGVASPQPYRVLELSEPARLVVDLRTEG